MAKPITHSQNKINLGNGADMAFLLVVLAAFFTMFSSLPEVTASQLITINLLGIAYIVMGIYGFGYFLQSDVVLLQLAYFAVQLFLGGAILLIGSGPESNVALNALLLLPLAVQSVVMLPRLGMISINILILLLFSYTLLRTPKGFEAIFTNLPLFFVGQSFVVFFTHMAVTEQHSRAEINRLVAELEHANHNLREYALQIEELAITQERNRLAREIHDGLGHYLTSIYMQIQAARMIMEKDSGKAFDSLQKAQNLAQDALNDVRHSVSTLRSPLIDNIPLSKAIERLLDQSKAGSMEAVFLAEGDERELSPQTSWTLYRAVQEAINNANKYAQADQVIVSLNFTDPNEVVLTFDDNGVGSTELKGGFGLMGLQERVKLLDGHFEIKSSSGEGFHIKIGVPG